MDFVWSVMDAIYQYFWYFVIFGFLGWVSEVIYAACIQKRFVNRGFLSAPFCPIYGFGVALTAFCLRSISDNVFLLFLGAVAITSLLELVAGFLMEKAFHIRWWDYSDSKLNLFGYISLGFSLLWGMAATFIIRMVLPVVDVILIVVPPAVSLIAFAALSTLLLVDLFTTMGAIVGINKQVRVLADIYAKIKETSKQMEGVTGALRAELEQHKKELAHRYETTLNKTGVIKRRVILAFPDLRNKRYDAEVTELQMAIKKIADDAKIFADDIEEKRQKLVLETYEDRLPKNAERPFGYGMCFNKLFILFMIGNVVGCVLETIWCFLVLHKFEMRVGLVYGPFVPVYGFGAVLITMFLYKFYKTRDLWLFLSSMVIGAGFECFASYFQEYVLGTVSWDYSGTLLNIDGRTNLLYAFIWGVLGLLWVKDLYPVISKLIERIPKRVGNIGTIALFIFMLFNAYISASAVIRQNERDANILPQTQFARYLDEHFDDERMGFIYPHMENVRQIQNPDNKETADSK